jgi:hypothetical protein
MRFDDPAYYSTQCPVDLLGCDRLDTPEAVIDHLLAEHDPRVIATILVRETYVNRRLWGILEHLPDSVEREIDGMIPDPMGSDDIIEIRPASSGG